MALVNTELTDRDLAHWQLSWSGPCRLVGRSGHDVDVRDMVETAVLEPLLVPALREWLEIHAGLDALPGPDELPTPSTA